MSHDEPSDEELAAVSGPAWSQMAHEFALRRLNVVSRLLQQGEPMQAVADMLRISRQALIKFVNNRSKKDGK